MLREIAVLLTVVTIVMCNQSCWQCSNEPNPAICRNNTITCPANEQCFLEMIVTNSKEVQYNAGCRSNTVCHIMQSLAGGATGKRSITLCSRCCTGPHCQDTLCSIMPGVGSSFLTCLSCDHVVSASACGNIEVCQDTEVCYAGIQVIGGLLRYSFGCESKHTCSATLDNSFGPGRAFVNGVEICSSCCVTDQCNNVDCFLLRKNMTAAMLTP